MNCANHTERTATAFCQNCGKALCPECTRSADGLLLCEPCLLARYPNSVPGAFPGGIPGAATIPGSAQTPYTPVAGVAGTYPPAAYGGHPSPFLAGLLGFIPGVGAMYNGQFIKGLLHVVIFIVLIGITSHLPLFGILIAAWEFYQVFDAAHTAAARRDGRPLPDPLGLLDLSQRMGPGAAYPAPGSVGVRNVPGTVPPTSPAGGVYAGGNVPRGTPYGAPYTAPGGVPGMAPGQGAAGYTPVSGAYAPVVPPEACYQKRRGEPIGAILLIALGLLFLLNTLDVLDFDWISRGWPVFLLVLGIWLLIRRANRTGGWSGPQGPPPTAGYPPQPTPPPASGTSLSIYPAGERAAGFEETAASSSTSFRSSEEEK